LTEIERKKSNAHFCEYRDRASEFSSGYSDRSHKGACAIDIVSKPVLTTVIISLLPGPKPGCSMQVSFLRGTWKSEPPAIDARPPGFASLQFYRLPGDQGTNFYQLTFSFMKALPFYLIKV